jgi:glycosyltransferase involved in cell wall biosynthesis
MNIYVNRRPVDGPWGGGSKMLRAIIDELITRGHAVYLDGEFASMPRADVILCIDPRPSSFVNYEMLHAYRQRHGSKIVQRVGDIGTHGKPDLRDLVNITTQYSDRIVFISNWAKTQVGTRPDAHVIANAASEVFFKRGQTDSRKIVTHHWSNNPMKGFDVYQSLDRFCEETGDYDFTFVGRCPENLVLRHHVQPLAEEEMSHFLTTQGVYVTASQAEAGGCHALEAIAAGLPVLYHRAGGGIVEYCEGRGIEFENFSDLVSILKNRRDEIEKIRSLPPVTRDAKHMAIEYAQFIEESA